MKIGDYVRTEISSLNIQKIGKIKEIYSEDIFHTDIGTYDITNIIKSSPNIIDLIEVGDYVNGYLVTTGNQNVGSIYIAEIDGLGLKKKLYEKDIKSIVTREMFESMEYKVKE